MPVHSPDSSRRQKSSGRKALQPKIDPFANALTSAANTDAKPKWATQCVDISNKENVHPMIQSFDSSLAQELSAIREKLERLRIDRENTDEVLRQRGLMLDSHMKVILSRWEDQKQLEMEVDRLYRLKEIRLSCMRISPVKSLREKEQEKLLQVKASESPS
ncbi:hypothetical protein F511_03376 [Dorcoceras hygrometricum]|uniref:Uncharacterized protein n=1 Tax=Dorcoceras hygrometricum TaxID=472368 RepID=A0A2Z7BFR9_9LAMI|nr:hypothetical protein F511_03376 [Dorcoceras hygrometricum]